MVRERDGKLLEKVKATERERERVYISAGTRVRGLSLRGCVESKRGRGDIGRRKGRRGAIGEGLEGSRGGGWRGRRGTAAGRVGGGG